MVVSGSGYFHYSVPSFSLDVRVMCSNENPGIAEIFKWKIENVGIKGEDTQGEGKNVSSEDGGMLRCKFTISAPSP